MLPDTAVILIALAAVLVVLVLRSPDPRPRSRRLEAATVIVQLKTGQALQGVMVEDSRAGFVLAQATVYEPGAEPKPADGVIMIDRADVAWIQTDAGTVPRLNP